jgi:competence ComEA-like helix-hairpin-helix protein
VFEKLSRKIGFTGTEIKVLFFIICVFIVGLCYKAYTIENYSTDYKNFDYSSEENIFLQSADDSTTENKDYSVDKNVDYKQEVLDFNDRNFKKKEAVKLPGRKSININTAGINDLVNLPGIGEKTAEKIIELREKKGRFNKLDELLEVRGIGSTKLTNIEKFLYIDQ